MIVFKRRTEAPDKSNKYYIRKAYGGVSPCMVGKPAYDGQKNALANCVGYAWGRVAEILSNPYIRVGYESMSATHPSDAHHWYKYASKCGFSTGKTAQLGAVACWRNKANTSGHVAVVEAITNGRVIVSESAYKGYVWRESSLAETMYKSGLVFQGFIYPSQEIVAPEPDNALRVGDAVEIIGSGNSQSDGKGKTAKSGLTRYIIKIYNGALYPYRVGYRNGVTTGFYQKGALRKV